MTLLYVKTIAAKEFSGMSGDLAGFCISLSELMMLFFFILFSKAVAL